MKYVEALPYLLSSGEGFSNGMDNEGAVQFVSELIELGCTVQAQLDHSLYDEEDYFDATLLVTLPHQITSGLIVLISRARPSEISEEHDNVLRLWWD